MEINKILESVLKSGEEKDTKAKWYYGELKNKNHYANYAFVFHIVLNCQNMGSIIPTEKNIANNIDFNDYLNGAIECYKKQYENTLSKGM